MGDKTGIQWTDATWNCFTGCTAVSPGCDNCYAASLASGRLAHVPAYAGLAEGGTFNGTVRLLPDRLDQPIRWRKPRRIFVNSMSDAFHGGVPDEFIAQVFAVMAATPRHQYQILTKRHSRMRALLSNPAFIETMLDYLPDLPGGQRAIDEQRVSWPLPNVWLGVSVEDRKRADLRIPALLNTPAAVRFLSCEPLLGPVSLTEECELTLAAEERGALDKVGYPIDGLDWVIVGGESGRDARPMHPDWAGQLRGECQAAGVPFFFKQWGEWSPLAPLDGDGRFDWSGARVVANDGTVYKPDDIAYPDGPRYGEAIRADHGRAHLTNMYRVGKHAAGRELNGRTWDEFPAEASV